MSRAYQIPAASTARRAPVPRASAAGAPLRAPAPRSTSTTRGVRAPTRGRTMPTQPPRQERNDDNVNNKTNPQDRTIHVGDGFHMFTPSTTKREQMRKQAEIEQRQYEAHVERTRLHNIHEVHRLGGDGLSEDEVRRKQAEKYRREKYTRLEKSHQEQNQQKQEEEKDIEAKKQAARLRAMENEKRDRDTQLRSMRSTVHPDDQGASGWTNEAREEDRRKTMDRFLNRLTQQYDDTNISSDEDQKKNHTNLSKSEKLSVLRDTLPHIDNQTLEYYLETYNGNVDLIVQELLN